jgi:hypothetical protein
VPGRPRQWSVAGDHGCVYRFGEGNVHGVVCAEVVSQRPRTRQKIEVSVTMEIEIGEVGDRLFGTRGGDFTGPHQTSKPLRDLDVQEVWRVQFLVLAEEAGLDACAKRVWPESSALALSLRCRVSGTLRICTILDM